MAFGVAFLLLTWASGAQALDALVPCGGTGQALCQTCDILKLVKNLFDFLFFYLMPVMATLLFLYAGFLILLGGMDPGTVQKGYKVFRNTGWGLLILVTAWLIVNTTLRTIAGDNNVAANWWQLECKDELVDTIGAVSPSPTASASANFHFGGGKSGGGGASDSWGIYIKNYMKFETPVNTVFTKKLEVDSSAKKPVTWKITSGDLPDGLKLNETSGEITGTPTKVATYEFTVQVQDSATPKAQGDKEFTATITAGNVGPTTCGDAELKTLAQQALTAGLSFSTDSTCGGGHQAKENITDIVAGRCPAVCNAGSCSSDGKTKLCAANTCPAGGTSGAATVNKNLMRAIIALGAHKQGASSIQISSLTTGSHSCGNDSHYLGNAVDITFSPATQTVAEAIRSFMKSQAGAIATQIACEGGGSFNTTGPCTNVGSSGFHIHAEVRGTGGAAGGGGDSGSGDKTCSYSSVNLCQASGTCPAPSCDKSSDGKFSYGIAIKQAAANIAISGVNTEALIRAVMFKESSCDVNSVSNSNPPSCGLMQLQPATANVFKSRCGVNADITCDWLRQPANAEASICIGAYYLQSIAGGTCGSSVRNIAAGYNGGAGACLASNDCTTAKSCDNKTVRRWECLYDDTAHQTCNAGFDETRNYAPKVLGCYNSNGGT